MKNELCRVALLCVMLPTGIAAAQEHAEPCEDDDHYATQGSVEVGGNVGMDWTQDLFTLQAGPSFGWFVADRFELSALLRVEYMNVEADDGSRSSLTSGSLILEPSYHVPLHGDAVFGFGGLGVGVGYDGDDADLEVIPRIGLNIDIGGTSVFTPALSVPLLLGPNQGADRDEFGLVAGVALEFGITSTL